MAELQAAIAEAADANVAIDGDDNALDVEEGAKKRHAVAAFVAQQRGLYV